MVAHPALLLALLPLLAHGKLPMPPYLKPCSMKLSRAEMTKCAVKSGNDALPHIMNGDRKYRVPAIEPLHIEKMKVDDGKGPLGLNMEANSIDVHGISKAVIKTVDFDFKAGKARYEVFIPVVSINHKYNISGRILLLPITGDGGGNLTLENVYVTYQYDFLFEKGKDGEVYFVPRPHDDFKLNTSRLHIQLDNLFQGEKLLGETTNKFMNENWEEMLVSIGPIFTTAISEIIHNLLTNVFSLVPATDAFLDSEDLLKNT